MEESDSKLSAAEIAGVVVGSLAGAFVIITCGFFLCGMCKKNNGNKNMKGYAVNTEEEMPLETKSHQYTKQSLSAAAKPEYSMSSNDQGEHYVVETSVLDDQELHQNGLMQV